jgi:uncharacterized membrane protein YdbT with pleckstrin-like domain
VDNLTKGDGEQIEEQTEEQSNKETGEQSNKETGEQSDKKTEEQIEKDADSQKNRMDQLQKEFHMSDSDVEGLTVFLTSSKTGDILGIMEEMIKCETLNTRQKVAFAHALGIFRSEESMSFRIRSSQD